MGDAYRDAIPSNADLARAVALLQGRPAGTQTAPSAGLDASVAANAAAIAQLETEKLDADGAFTQALADTLYYPRRRTVLGVTTGGVPQLGVINLVTDLAAKALRNHDHDGRYYTETETNTLLAARALKNHTHTGFLVQGTGDDAYLVRSALDGRYYTKANLWTRRQSDGRYRLVTNLIPQASVSGLATALAARASSTHRHTLSYTNTLGPAPSGTGILATVAGNTHTHTVNVGFSTYTTTGPSSERSVASSIHRHYYRRPTSMGAPTG